MPFRLQHANNSSLGILKKMTINWKMDSENSKMAVRLYYFFFFELTIELRQFSKEIGSTMSVWTNKSFPHIF